MKRGAAFLAFGTLVFAQEGRNAYREAYQAWRTVDPTLERDAATADAVLGARADKVSAAATKYLGEKKTFADARLAAAGQVAQSIEAVTIRKNTSEQEKNGDSYLGLQTSAVTASIRVFGNDPDRGIQQLRDMMERERATLSALTDALKESRSASAAAFDAAEQAEQERMKFTALLNSFAASFQQSADGAAQQGTSWPAYYRALAESASGAGLTGPPTESPNVSTSASPIGAPAPSASSTGPSAETRALQPAIPSAGPPAAPSAVPSDTAPARVVSTVPLSRYVGAWSFTPPGSMFFGPQPEFVDVVIHEENGEITGSLYARFKLPSGSNDDPVVRFDFHGALKSARNQSFPLLTNDGAMGTIELIPGPAFNLLEVNFKAAPATGKIRQGNFILLKK